MTSMLVVVDRFNKYAVFIPPLATYTTKKTMKLFLRYVVKLFGAQADIITDQDSQLTGQFWIA